MLACDKFFVLSPYVPSILMHRSLFCSGHIELICFVDFFNVTILFWEDYFKNIYLFLLKYFIDFCPNCQ